MMDDEKNELNEPPVEYNAQATRQKHITFFKSFEEADEHKRRQMALMTPVELLENLEQMRRHFMSHLLLPNGKWPLAERVIHIKKGSFKDKADVDELQRIQNIKKK